MGRAAADHSAPVPTDIIDRTRATPPRPRLFAPPRDGVGGTAVLKGRPLSAPVTQCAQVP